MKYKKGGKRTERTIQLWPFPPQLSSLPVSPQKDIASCARYDCRVFRYLQDIWTELKWRNEWRSKQTNKLRILREDSLILKEKDQIKNMQMHSGQRKKIRKTPPPNLSGCKKRWQEICALRLARFCWCSFIIK